jgi:hypothetical protein
MALGLLVIAEDDDPAEDDWLGEPSLGSLDHNHSQSDGPRVAGTTSS